MVLLLQLLLRYKEHVRLACEAKLAHDIVLSSVTTTRRSEPTLLFREPGRFHAVSSTELLDRDGEVVANRSFR